MKRFAYFTAGAIAGASALAYLVQQGYVSLPEFYSDEDGCCGSDCGCGDENEEVVSTKVEIKEK